MEGVSEVAAEVSNWKLSVEAQAWDRPWVAAKGLCFRSRTEFVDDALLFSPSVNVQGDYSWRVRKVKAGRLTLVRMMEPRHVDAVKPFHA